METKVYTIDNFSAGQCSGLNQEKIPANGVYVAQNCLIDVDGSLYKYGGKRLFLKIGSSTEHVVNQVLYKKSNGPTKNIVVTYDTSVSKQKVYYYSDTSNEYVEITGFISTFGQNTLVRLLSYSDVLWIIDGTYTYIWNGSELARADSGGDVPLLPSDFDGASLITQAHGIIYLSGYVNNPSMVAYSRYVNDSGYYILPTDSDAWDATNVFMLPQEGQIIKAIYGYRDMLFIWTQDKTWVLTGYVGNSSTSLKPVFDIGCISQESVRVVNNVLYWCAYDGIYAYDGELRKISTTIKDYFEDVATQFQNNIYNVYNNTQEEYEDFTTFVNCNYSDLPGSIVPSSYPYVVDHSLTLFNMDGFLNDTASTSVIQSFTTQSKYSGTYKLRVYVNRIDKGITYTAKIKGNYDDTTAIATATFDLSGLPSYSPSQYGRGFIYATFNLTTNLESNTTYYIEIDNSNHISFMMSNNNGWEGNLRIYYNVQPTPIYRPYTSDYRITMFLYPTESYFYTDVYNISPISFLSNINCIFDEMFVDDEVSLSSSSGYTLAYRYSTDSESDCLSKNWTVFNNNSIIKEISDILPVSNLYVQFKIIMKSKNIYQDTTQWFIQKMLCKFDGIKFYANSSGYLSNKNYFANSYNDKYMISIPEIGKSYNQKIFVLNNGNAWTYFDINTDCFWQYKEDLFFADNTNNNIYYLQKVSSLPTNSLDTFSELSGYSEVVNMEATTIGSKDYLQEFLKTGDPLNVSDNFNDDVLDSKWITWGNSGVSESDGYLNFVNTSGTKMGGIYQTNVKQFRDFISSINYVDGLKYSDYGSDKLYFNVGDASNMPWKEKITTTIEKASTDYNVYVRQYDKDGDYVSGVSITGVNVSGLKYERDISTNVVNVYYNDGSTWISAYTASSCFIDVYNFGFEISVQLDSNVATTVICDTFVFSGDYYADTGYAIYDYTASSNTNLQLFYSVPTIYSDQKITLYYAINFVRAVRENTSEYDKYRWVKLIKITQDNNVGNVIFKTPSNSIRKILVEYEDGGSSGNTFLLDYIKMYEEQNFKTVIELPYIEIREPNKEKYLRKCYIGVETDSNYGLYYKTEKMDGWHYTERSPEETRIGLKDEHGQKLKVMIVSPNSSEFKLKHLSIMYKEHKHR